MSVRAGETGCSRHFALTDGAFSVRSLGRWGRYGGSQLRHDDDFLTHFAFAERPAVNSVRLVGRVEPNLASLSPRSIIDDDVL